MAGLALIWNSDSQSAELVIAGREEPDAALRTAVILSLFCDRRALADDVLPEAGGDRRGWWADAWPAAPGDLTGSGLWRLARGKRTAETVRQVRDLAAEALAWMTADRLAASVEVEAEAFGAAGIALAVTITRPAGPARDRFDFLWEPR